METLAGPTEYLSLQFLCQSTVNCMIEYLHSVGNFFSDRQHKGIVKLNDFPPEARLGANEQINLAKTN